MKSRFAAGKLFAIGLMAFAASIIVPAGQVFADTMSTNMPMVATQNQNVQLIPLEIEPVCSDSATMLSYWKVTNKNASDVNIDWTNIDYGHNGSFNATSGVSQLTTYYDGTDPNNTTRFVSAGNTTQTNATAAGCVTTPIVTPPTPACVDGKIQQNLSVTWINHNTVSVHTAGNQPLCADVDLYLSSYVMPDNYDGNGFFGNPTATPQTKFASDHVVLGAGTDGTATLTVALPDSCRNIQIDLYYGPEITTVGPNGHGSQNISAQVYRSTGSCYVCPPTGGQGGGTVTPPATPIDNTPTTPAPTPGKGGGTLVTAAPAAQLQDTGLSLWISTLAAVSLIATAVAISRSGRSHTVRR